MNVLDIIILSSLSIFSFVCMLHICADMPKDPPLPTKTRILIFFGAVVLTAMIVIPVVLMNNGCI